MAPTELRQQVAAALENGQLAGALGRFSEAYAVSRAKAYQGIDFEALRDQLVALKGRAASQLDELADQFEAGHGGRARRCSGPPTPRR